MAGAKMETARSFAFLARLLVKRYAVIQHYRPDGRLDAQPQAYAGFKPAAVGDAVCVFIRKDIPYLLPNINLCHKKPPPSRN